MVAMYLDPEDWNALRALAEADGRSLSQTAARLIRPMLARGGPAPYPPEEVMVLSAEELRRRLKTLETTDPALQRRGDERPAKEDRLATARKLVAGLTGTHSTAEDGAPVEAVLVREEP